MDWETLDETIPFIEPSTEHPLLSGRLVVLDRPHGQVVVEYPGEFWERTNPKGGDFHVKVTSKGAQTLEGQAWVRHGFSHSALFEDVEVKTDVAESFMRTVFSHGLIEVVAEGADPTEVADGMDVPDGLPGLEPDLVLTANQCLALAEHRSYARYEPLGGRCLPLRYALGIIFGCWTAAQATRVSGTGSGGLRRLRARAREPAFETVLGRDLRVPACEEP